ncbi:MAG TPA: FMN-binding protein [Victivallales bacterium]|nr:FMN-binding protein [Victivallales bacterium]
MSSFSVYSGIRLAGTKIELLSPSMLKGTLGDNVTLEFVPKPLPHIKIIDTKSPNLILAYAFNSADLQVSAKGYKDLVDCYVLLSPEGKIISVMLGDNKETKKYLKRVLDGKLLKSWEGKKSSETTPDSISGATFTSKAVNGSVKAVLDKLSEVHFFK